MIEALNVIKASAIHFKNSHDPKDRQAAEAQLHAIDKMLHLVRPDVRPKSVQ